MNSYRKNPKTTGIAKVPVVMQLESLECGAACLAMILAYYGKWVPLEKLRVDCDVSRDGCNAKSIYEAAKKYELEANAYEAEPEELLTKVSFPCLLFWNNNHFVVLDGFLGKRAVVNDPAKGKVYIPWNDFKRQFSSFLITFSPTSKFEPSGKKQSVFRYAKDTLKGSRSLILLVFLISLVSAILGLINPVFSRLYIDDLLSGKYTQMLYPFILCLSGFTLIYIFINWFSVYYNLRIQGKMEAVSNSSFLWKVLRLPIHFFEQRFAGDISQRQASNSQIAYTLVNIFAPLAINAATAILYLVLMINYSTVLTIIGLGALILNLIISFFVSRVRINITRASLLEGANLNGFTVSGLNIIETIKASGSEEGFFKNWANYQASYNYHNVRYMKFNQYANAIPTFLSSLSSVLVLGIGVLLVINGEISLGMIMAFQGFLSSFLSPAGKIITAGQSLQEMRSQIERVEDVMKYPEDTCFDDQVAFDKKNEVSKNSTDINQKDILKGNIEVNNLTFGYSRNGGPVVKDFNMKLKSGQKVAIVGKTGCGKSTIAKLLSGLYEPWSGQILYDGKNRNQIKREVFVDCISVVDQDIILYKDTISNNIKLWNSNIEDFEVILAARDACIHDEIIKMEGGYQHKIREEGRDLSGGQRQRLEIARALVQDPSICILDEATSSLDAKTEGEIIKAITDRGITCIFVAHRLSTIRDCDEIIVLNNGEIVERGTHQELCKLNNYYSALIKSE